MNSGTLSFLLSFGILLAGSAGAAGPSPFKFAPATENFVYSPYGVESVLALIRFGAKGDTANEIRKVFPDLDREAAGPASANGEGFRFTNVNSAWIRKNFPVLPAFTAKLSGKAHADITSLDFKDAAADSARINAWVKKSTEGKISELIEPRMITTDLRMILVNALYFKAKWETPFEPYRTRSDDFHPAKGTAYKVDFMHENRSFSVIRRKNYDIAILPYAGRHQTLWLALPHAGTALEKLEEAFDEFGLEKKYSVDREESKPTLTSLALPKFSITSDLSLVPYLEKRGIERLFHSETSDLSGVSAEKPLFVSDIIQRAVIDLDEEGTEAAAATAGMVLGGSALRQEKPLELNFDRPFAYFLRDEKSGKILFMGRVARPPEAKIRK